MKYYDPNGCQVTAADALSHGVLRKGYSQSLKDGEYLSFNMLLMDAKPKADEASIDAVLRARIATMAKNSGQTPDQYLASTPLEQIKKMAAEAAAEVIESLSGRGVASKLADEKRARETIDYLRKARFNGPGPMIMAEDSDNPAPRPSGISTSADLLAAIRQARYSN